jgi:hypothetical protein
MQIRKSLERGMAAWNLTRHGLCVRIPDAGTQFPRFGRF